MKRRVNLDLWTSGRRISLSEETNMGTHIFVYEGKSLGWFKKTETGFMYFHKGNVLFFKSLTELLKFADIQLGEETLEAC